MISQAQARPAVYSDIAKILADVRTPKWCLEHAGLRRHAAVAELTGDKITYSVADAVLYRLDKESQFADLSAAAAGEGPAGGLHAGPFTLGDAAGVMRWAALEHFHAVHATMDPSQWFLCRVGQPGDRVAIGDSLPFETLASAISTSFNASAAIAEDGQVMQFEEETPRGSRTRMDTLDSCATLSHRNQMHRLLLFKVAHLKPSLLRRARGDTSANLRSSDIGITIYDIDELDWEKME